MNHRYIADYDVVGQYRRGLLAIEEASAFEAHLIDCVECQAQLDADLKLELGLRAIASSTIEEHRSENRRSVKPVYLASAAAAALLAIAASMQWQSAHVTTLQGDVPLFQFAITRSSGNEYTEIRIPATAAWYVIELESPSAEHCCRVVIEDAEGGLVWRDDAVIVNPDGIVRILLSRSQIPKGKYRVALLSTAPDEARLVEHRLVVNFEG